MQIFCFFRIILITDELKLYVDFNNGRFCVLKQKNVQFSDCFVAQCDHLDRGCYCARKHFNQGFNELYVIKNKPLTVIG